MVNGVGVPARREPNTVNGQQQRHILVGGRSNIADNEGECRALRVFPAVSAMDE